MRNGEYMYYRMKCERIFEDFIRFGNVRLELLEKVKGTRIKHLYKSGTIKKLCAIYGYSSTRIRQILIMEIKRFLSHNYKYMSGGMSASGINYFGIKELI